MTLRVFRGSQLSRSHILDRGSNDIGHRRDIASEIDYSDNRSAIENIGTIRKRNASQISNQLNKENLHQLDRKLGIYKGGGGSVYSEVRSQVSYCLFS